MPRVLPRALQRSSRAEKIAEISTLSRTPALSPDAPIDAGALPRRQASSEASPWMFSQRGAAAVMLGVLQGAAMLAGAPVHAQDVHDAAAAAAALEVSRPTLSADALVAARAALWSAHGRAAADMVTVPMAPVSLTDTAEVPPAVKAALLEVADGPNAARAQQVADTLAAVPGMLDSPIAPMLVRAVGQPRTGGANGAWGVMSPASATRLAKAWPGSPATARAQVTGLLDAAKSPLERALILQASAARADRLGTDGALVELTRFASAIRGMEPGKLAQLTSLRDVDERVDAAAFDALALDVPIDRPLDYTFKDNDGLFQRFENSCGPTGIEVLRGNVDPIYALDQRTRDITLVPDPAKDFQLRILQDYGEDPTSRLAPYYQREVSGRLAQLVQQGKLGSAAKKSLEGWLFEGQPRSAASDAALAKVRAESSGFPSAGVVETLRNHQAPAAGAKFHRIGLKNIERILNETAGKDAGVRFELVTMYDGTKLSDDEVGKVSEKFVAARLDEVAKALSDGNGVMFSTTWPDHFWTMHAVRGQPGARDFLVHDSWSGKTAWVTEKQVRDGSFAKDFLGESKVWTRIDLFYLPR